MGSSRSQLKRDDRSKSASGWLDKQKRGYEPTHFKTPEGVERFKFAEGIQEIDVVPYLVGWGNPYADEGFLYWMREFAVHKIPSADGNNDRYLCLYETFNKPCPVCKKINSREVTEDQKSALWGQKRLVMYVNPKPGKVNTPLQLLDAVYFNRKLGFGQKLVGAIEMAEDPDRAKEFFDHENGMTLKIDVADEKYQSVNQINFRKRNYVYPDDVIKDLQPLEDCLIVPLPDSLKGTAIKDLTDDDWKDVYRELERILLVGLGEDVPAPSGGSKADKPSRSSSSRASVSEDEDNSDGDQNEDDGGTPPKKGKLQAGDEVIFEKERHTVKKVEANGKLHLADENDVVTKNVDPSEVELVDDDSNEDQEEEAPRRVSRR